MRAGRRTTRADSQGRLLPGPLRPSRVDRTESMTLWDEAARARVLRADEGRPHAVATVLHRQHSCRTASSKGTAAKKTLGRVASTTAKFIEGYADALGKGAAALTIGAAGALLFQMGLGTDVLTPLWD